LPVPRGPSRTVLAAGEEVELGEVKDAVATQRGLEGEVELFDRLAGWEPGGLDAGLAAVLSRLSISVLSSTSAKRS